jgi:hypothetical protein
VQYYQNLLTENRPEYKGTQKIKPIQMDGEIVEVIEKTVRKAVRELKLGNRLDQKEFMRKLKTWNR